MKSLTLVPNALPVAHAVPIPLHQLIDQLMIGLLPLTVEKKSFFINDVDRTFFLQSDENVLAYVLGNLLSGAVSSSENVCIRVETVIDEEYIQIKMSNNGTYVSGIASNFAQVVKAARQLGGNISVYNQKNQGTTITLSIATQKIAC